MNGAISEFSPTGYLIIPVSESCVIGNPAVAESGDWCYRWYDDVVSDKLSVYISLHLVRGYSVIGSGSGFTVNLGSDSLGRSNDLLV